MDVLEFVTTIDLIHIHIFKIPCITIRERKRQQLVFCILLETVASTLEEVHHQEKAEENLASNERFL